jgi:hypothetical protein
MVVVEIFDDLCSVADGFQASVVGAVPILKRLLPSPSFLARPARCFADGKWTPESSRPNREVALFSFTSLPHTGEVCLLSSINNFDSQLKGG